MLREMRALVQRVSQARVEVDGHIVGSIGPGILILLGIAKTDVAHDADYLANKVANLRIFDDDLGKLNLSVKDTGGAALVVSQFTLYGDCRKGRRPSYDDAAAGEHAKGLYEHFVEAIRREVTYVACGVFQATMAVHLVNEGPVTLMCESVTIQRRK
jgi:D-aminoacyl-tRNA deacylase